MENDVGEDITVFPQIDFHRPLKIINLLIVYLMTLTVTQLCGITVNNEP